MDLSVQTAGAAPRDTMRIAAGTDVARHDLAGALVRIRAGRVWLTQHTDIRDYIVAAGDEVRIDREGPVVMEALRDAVIEIERAATPAMSRAARIGWRYWTATAVLLALALLGGVAGALAFAIALTAVQTMHMLALHGRITAPAVQTRIGYLGLLLAGLWSPLAFVHWVQLAGTCAVVTVDYCPMARIVSLMPWNRRGAMTLAAIAQAFLTPPRRWRFASAAVAGAACPQ